MERITNRRRRALAALTLTTLLVLVPAATAQGRPDRRPAKVPSSLCRIDWRRGPSHVKRLIKCAAHRWKVPGGAAKALQVAECESGFNPAAYSNGNAGVFQQRVTYWPDRAKAYGFPGWSPYNGRANVIVSIRMAHNGGWSPWSCA